MRPKIKIRLTILRMLAGLVIMSVFVTAVLAITSLTSNSRLVESQRRLTEIVMPMERAAQQVRTAVMDVSLRQHQIADAATPEALSAHADRSALESAFSEGIDQLKALSDQAAADALARKIPRIEDIYAGVLKKDEAMYNSVERTLGLKAGIETQVAALDLVGAELSASAESFSNRVSLAITRQVKDASADETLPEGVTDIVLSDLTRLQKAGSELRLAIATLTNGGRQILLAREVERVRAIRDDKIERTVESVALAIENLKLSGIDDGELMSAVETLEDRFNRLRSILIGEDGSIAVLQVRWIMETAGLDTLSTELSEITAPLMTSLDEIQTLSGNVRHRVENNVVEVSRIARQITILVGPIAILCMLIIGPLTIRRIVLPIQKVSEFADTIAEGDLTAEIDKDHDDEIGRLVEKLSEMAHNLNTLIGQVQRSGIQVTSSATELSATSKQQEAVMKTQMESTNYVVKSVGEISKVSEELVETMQQVAAMSDQTADFANSGQSDLSQMEAAMGHMENASKSISGKLEAINEKAANITSVVTTITKVADQTNLLSLNAAIEAEKAGEYGRGFTVVAREIRRLADQTAVATLDIDQMVQEMQSAVSAGVMEMDAFIAEVQRSAENVGKISNQLTRIIEQVKALSPSFEGVNESMQFQSDSAQQINTSMVNLSEEMQQTVESLKESFMAIEQLNDAARGLQDEVSRFKVA
jgi:methyl-accepting chemotaxis protein